jgi:hypothetical protein
MKQAEKIPYVFILDNLAGVDIIIKPMFGCYSIYAGAKLCLFLVSRDKPLIPNGRSQQNGIYVATTTDWIDSLKIDFPGAEFDRLKDKKAWLYLSEAGTDFEKDAIKACEMISAFDARIGR